MRFCHFLTHCVAPCCAFLIGVSGVVFLILDVDLSVPLFSLILLISMLFISIGAVTCGSSCSRLSCSRPSPSSVVDVTMVDTSRSQCQQQPERLSSLEQLDETNFLPAYQAPQVAHSTAHSTRTYRALPVLADPIGFENCRPPSYKSVDLTDIRVERP